MPFSSGIETSMTTTSGLSSLAFSKAALPLSASPTTDMSACALTSDLNPSRMTVWSSAKKMRSVFTWENLLFGRCVNGNANHQGRASTGLRFDIKASADQCDALPYAQQSESAPFARHEPDSLRVKPLAVIFYNR